jgi:hypothetical protein
MYWYLYYGANTLETFRHWLNRTGGQYREDQRHEEDERALHDLFRHQDLQSLVSEQNDLE